MSDGYGEHGQRGRYEEAGGSVRGAFEVILDGSREPAFPSVTDAAVVGGRRIRRRRTAVSGAAGVLVAAVLAAGVVAALPGGAGPDRSSVPMAPSSGRPSGSPSTSPSDSASGSPTGTAGPVAPRPSTVPSKQTAVPTPSALAPSGSVP
ncbi:hypothetical protein [Streptomyces sp. BK205]|uniref:hypothetical protein n=1 Tax=Streptomyces TaxID=1883 RepID=UPI00105114A0|nr:hypothetical protein [Streptomyces sp. BK205]TCR15384.1 hypothetical protein EV578_11780 [Streptomyces sp. BK205]